MLVSRHPQLSSECHLVAECQFVVDPDDPYRYVCLHCGQERSIKKQSETALEPSLVGAVIGAAIMAILLLPALDHQQPATPALPSRTVPAATH